MYSNGIHPDSNSLQIYTTNTDNTVYQKSIQQKEIKPAINLTEGIQEDELVEFNESEELENNKTQEQDKLDILFQEYQNEMSNYFKYQTELLELQRQQRDVQRQIINAKNKNDILRLQSSAQTIETRVAEANNNLQTSNFTLRDINAQIISAMCDSPENIQISLESSAKIEKPVQTKNLYTPINSNDTKNTQNTNKSYTVQNVQYTGNTISKDVAAKLDNKLGKGFSQKCEQVATYLGCNTNDLLAMMYSESGLKTDARNKGSNAIGLIQCIPSTLAANGYSTEQVAKMNAVEQLDVVADIFMKSKKMAGYGANEKIDGGTLYAINWLPAYAKKDTLAVQNGKYYSRGLDMNKDGSVTKNDLSQRLQAKYNEMLKNI